MENSIDTICELLCSNNSILVVQKEQPFFTLSISLGDIIAIIGLILSYYLFWKQIKETRKDGKKNLRDTWLLEVIIEPSLDKITSFYEECIKTVEKDLNMLSSQFSKLTAEEFQKSLAKTKRKNKDLKKTSLEHFQALIRATEPKLSSVVDGIMDSLIDDITELLDKYEEFGKSPNMVEDKLLNNKQLLLSALYKSIK